MSEVERGSSKHGPRLDDQMAREVEGQVQGRPAGARAQEWREAEPPADGQPNVSWTPHGHHGMETNDDRDPDYRDERALIASYLPRGTAMFPATRAQLIEAAESNHAPDDVLRVLQRLPEDAEFSDAREFWEAIHLPSGPRF